MDVEFKIVYQIEPVALLIMAPLVLLKGAELNR